MPYQFARLQNRSTQCMSRSRIGLLYRRQVAPIFHNLPWCP